MLARKRLPKKDYLFVSVQFILFIAYVLPFRLFSLPLPQLVVQLGFLLVCVGSIIGMIALLQLNTSLSPFPSPSAKSILVQKGIFALVRHPIYSAILCVVLGYGLFQSSTYKLLITLGLWTLFYFKSKYEEALLIKKYPAYTEYQQKTGRLFPRLFH